MLTVVVAIAAVLLFRPTTTAPRSPWLGAWTPPLGISLVADRLSALMLLVSAVVTLAVLAYSVGQGMTGDEREAPVSIYHPTFLVLVAGVSNAFLAGDLFNLFVSFEMLLFASYVLLTLGGTETRIRAGHDLRRGQHAVSSSLFLISIAAVYAATGSLNLAQLAGAHRRPPRPRCSLTLQLLLLTTFSVKAAVFPLSLWLPDSYPTAPAPVTAVFAGLLTKVGVYAILRTQTLLFPDSPLTDLLLWAALVTMVVGILGAIAQSDIKRMLSFTPRSSSLPARTRSVDSARTSVGTPYAAATGTTSPACSSPPAPCSRSSSTQSTPAAAQTSALIGDAAPKKVPTATSPLRSRRFSAPRSRASGAHPCQRWVSSPVS